MLNRLTLPRIVPFAIYLGFLALADLLARLGWSEHQLRLLYVVKIAAVVLALLAYRRRYSELRPPRLPWRQAALALLAGLLVFLLWINLTAPWMMLGQPGGFDPRVDGAIVWPLALLRAAGATLVVPLMEELFWRSFLLRWLSQEDFLALNPAHAKITVFVGTVILFGIEHQLWLAGMVAGAVYGGLYMSSRNLWAPILAHTVTNGVLAAWILATAQWTFW
ncbi:CAAX prenyl protease-related protein [Duganella callida]|uniref:CAAX prenyl protease-related protein n=1 Tax=Duganella callida TaxID=2561932 RepID=A0A4Y9SRX3_9BURK|nr:CAAX prenyl protease-related protein [Duganella callida]TFW27506.1 CAAX prenyl protease-related protein [Duganella callida]